MWYIVNVNQKIIQLGTREIAQWVRAFSALAEDLGSVSNTQCGSS